MQYSVVDLESYPFDLTVWQLADLLRRSGRPVHPRTIHNWLKSGYVTGYHPREIREWRIHKASALQVLRRRLAA